MTQYSAIDHRPAGSGRARRAAEVAIARCDEIAAFSDLDGRISRGLGDPSLERATDAVEGWMREAGLACRRDGFGNLIGSSEAPPGTPVLLLGSHLDTVPDGGRYDGALGVLLALALVEELPASLPFAVEVLAFADEEGRFGKGCLGSRAYVGELAADDLALRRGDGRTLGDCLRAVGRRPEEAIGRSELPAETIGYCEVHIEQGTTLEELDLPVGVVTRILGKTRGGAELVGCTSHAGAGVESRRDASCGMAELVLAAERSMLEDAELRATLGELRVWPQAVNVVPGRATVSIDMRHPDDVARRTHLRRLEAEATSIASARDLDLVWTRIEEGDAIASDPGLTEALLRSVAAAGLRAPTLVSAAGHDAAVVGGHAPVAMLFVRCRGGITHHPDESVEGEDVAAALDVLSGFVVELAAMRAGEGRRR